MLNIVIPMAGAGSRFVKAGYSKPKPLILINQTPMIKLVIDNLTPLIEHRFIFICQKEHDLEFSLNERLKEWAPNSELVTLNGVTEGAACTVLETIEYINNDEPLMIANSDQYISENINEYINNLNFNNLDGLIMTMYADDPKWSYVDLDHNKNVRRVVEKEVISNEATVGIYNFKYGKDFVKSAQEMIKLNDKVNNEFYVAPVYNYLIKNQKNIGIYNIGRVNNGMYGLGTPEDLDYFLGLPISKNI
jgi:dTDP-glucose pyrophosphorylase